MPTQKEIQYLLDNFDYDGLCTLGFFKGIDRNDYDRQIKRICEWFGLSNIFQYETVDMQKEKYFIADFKTFSEN